MRKVFAPFLAFVLIVGCASLDTNRKKLAAIDSGFTVTVSTLNSLYDTGAISQKDWDSKVAPARDAVDVALDQAWKAVDSDAPTFLEALRAVNAALDALIRIRMEAERPKSMEIANG